MSSFTGITMASQAMQAFTTAIDTVGENISNVNTPGYSRQIVNFADLPATQVTAGGTYQVGNGVSITSISSVRDLFLLSRQLGSSSDLSNTNQQLTGNSQIQSMFNETGTSSTISTDLTNFYNSWSSLASNPGQAAGQQAVQQAGETLANDIRGTYSQLQNFQSQTSTQITSTISSIQNYANQVGKLNQEIRVANATGASANGLMDQRQQALQSLAGLVNINTQTNKDGTITVDINQFQLVNQSGAMTFPTSFNAANGTVSDANGTYNVDNGQLAGLFSQLNTVTSTMGQMDNMANALRTQVNTIMQTGTNGLGATGQNFFQDVTPPAPQTGAINFQVDPAVQANYQAIAAGVSGNGGDGGVALAIAQSINTTVPGLGNVTIPNYFTNILSTIGTNVSTLSAQHSTQQALGTQIANQIQSTSGVSLDQEMSQLVMLQQSYQAAAKSLSMADQNMQYLLQMIPG
jgi:flagellar hook-associated protein 1 FlgK